MLTLQPQNYFTLVRQISNHLDTATYYVRAVIRNAYTDTIIDTLNLTDKGGQRFKYDWMVPADPSGQGFYISVVTSIYTDSDYTSKSPNYGDDENTYLIQDRILVGRIGGQSGGADAFEIRQIVSGEVDRIIAAYQDLEKTEETPEPADPAEPMRWDEILASLEDMKSILSEDKEPNIIPILARLDVLAEAIAAKEVTEPTDLSPVIDLLDQHEADRKGENAEIKQIVEETNKALAENMPKILADVLDKKQFKTELVTRVVQEQPKETPPRIIDIKDLSQ